MGVTAYYSYIHIRTKSIYSLATQIAPVDYIQFRAEKHNDNSSLTQVSDNQSIELFADPFRVLLFCVYSVLIVRDLFHVYA